MALCILMACALLMAAAPRGTSSGAVRDKPILTVAASNDSLHEQPARVVGAPSETRSVPAVGRRDYATIRAKLSTDREALHASYVAAKDISTKKRLIQKARARLLSAIRDELIPPWVGTAWAFYGTSETPGQGEIACGYFVSTVLRDAALKVERVRLAQQASEKIVKTLSAEADIRRYRRGDVQKVVEDTRARGDGLYVVGMDFHVAFLDVKGDDVRLCHSAVLEPRAVTCEPAAKAEGMVSAYHVVGPALSDARVLDWLFGRAVPTRLD